MLFSAVVSDSMEAGGITDDNSGDAVAAVVGDARDEVMVGDDDAPVAALAVADSVGVVLGDKRSCRGEEITAAAAVAAAVDAVDSNNEIIDDADGDSTAALIGVSADGDSSGDA